MKKIIVTLVMVIMMASSAFAAKKEHEFNVVEKTEWTSYSGDHKESIRIMRDDETCWFDVVKTNGELSGVYLERVNLVDSLGNRFTSVITIR